jgi:tetratricopeptide (TPR) repeat protein
MARRSAEAEKESKDTKAAGKPGANAPAAAKPSPPASPAPAPRTPPVGGRFVGIATDPAMQTFTDGMAALYRKDWAKAEELLGPVAANRDLPELADRARLLLTAARQKAAESAPRPKETEGEDPYLRALFEKNRGEVATALEMCQKDGRDQKDERFAYLVAAIHAAENRTEDAARALTRAIELNPKNRIHAYHDPDFAELRRNRDFRPLFGLS